MGYEMKARISPDERGAIAADLLLTAIVKLECLLEEEKPRALELLQSYQRECTEERDWVAGSIFASAMMVVKRG
jgi:hypothetical protein